MTEAELKRIHAETDKLLAENRKLMSEANLNDKKTKWYELALAIAFGAVIATIIAKL